MINFNNRNVLTSFKSFFFFFFYPIYFSRTKSLNLAGIFIVRFGLLCGSVVSDVVTGKGEITGLVSASAFPEFSGSSGVL